MFSSYATNGWAASFVLVQVSEGANKPRMRSPVPKYTRIGRSEPRCLETFFFSVLQLVSTLIFELSQMA